MPLVRIDVTQGGTDEELTLLADTIQEVLIETFSTPELDRCQIIHEHRSGTYQTLDTGLGYPRNGNLVVLQITQQGRTTSQKQAMYALMSKRLDEIGVPLTDLIIS